MCESCTPVFQINKICPFQIVIRSFKDIRGPRGNVCVCVCVCVGGGGRGSGPTLKNHKK